MTASLVKPFDRRAMLLWVVTICLAGIPAVCLSVFVATYDHAYDFLRCPDVDFAWALTFGLAAIGLGPGFIVLGLGVGLGLPWVRPFVAALCIGIVSILVGAYWMSQEPLSLNWQGSEQCLQSGML